MKYSTVFLLLPLCVWGQKGGDSVKIIPGVDLKKVRKGLQTATSSKISTIEKQLADAGNITLIRRGEYAWEPSLYHLGAERTDITVDGMHVFGACTDKMDPVTTYLDQNALTDIEINNGAEGTMAGQGLVGNVNLRRQLPAFSTISKWSGRYLAGYQTNNQQWLQSARVTRQSAKLVFRTDVSYRHAENYNAGGGTEINHSQYQKANYAAMAGYQPRQNATFTMDAVLDVAKNVGFPALLMDLWLSRAVITSLGYRQKYDESLVNRWESKIYYNAAEHYMDDTTRPENKVHMDMPGWSTTVGALSTLHARHQDWSAELQLNLYRNRSIAEMKMYPQDRSNLAMFAYSWPWVTTTYGGVAGKFNYNFSPHSSAVVSAALGAQHSKARYPEFNRIFYPDVAAQRLRAVPALHFQYGYDNGGWTVKVHSGVAERAPSTSEAYGYYIYNSFDRYDYVGNPSLPNERAWSAGAEVTYRRKGYHIVFSSDYFRIKDYIVGEVLHVGSPMNYQSVGVKGYTAIPYAQMQNLHLHLTADLLPKLQTELRLGYARAKDAAGDALPFVRPFNYHWKLHWKTEQFSLHTGLQGDAAQRFYSVARGEDGSQPYHIWDMLAEYRFTWAKHRMNIQFGVDNILDRHYTTYADWGNLPRMGRNFTCTVEALF